MKKSLIMLLVLMVVGAMAFAEDAKPTFTISGDATAKAGVDLNNSASGIENSNSATLKVVLVPKTTATKGGEGDVVGEITIKDYGLTIKGDGTFTDNKNGDVSAKLLMGPVYVQLVGKPDFSFDFAANIAGNTDVNLKKSLPGYGGIALGYTSDAFSGSVGVIADNPWYTQGAKTAADAIDPIYPITDGVSKVDSQSATTANVNNYYGVGASLVLKPVSMFEVDANVIYYTNTASTTPIVFPIMGIGGKVIVKPVDAINFSVGGDFFNNTTYPGIFDILAALTGTFGDDTLTASVYYNSLTVAQGATNATETDAKVEFVEADGDKGYVPGLGADVAAEFDNLLGTMTWNVDAKINYTIDTVKPYGEVKYFSTNKILLGAGLTFTGWTNTTVTLDYIAKDVTNVDAGEANNIGVATLAVKVAY